MSTLSELPPDITPPADLERRTIAALRSRGLLLHGRRPRALPLVAAAALIAIAFGAGWFGHARIASTSPASDRARFALFLYGAPAGADEAARVNEYVIWARTTARERGVSGEKLGDAAVTIGGRQPSEGELGGFFIIEASDLQEAAAVASRHPHVRHGGIVLVRPIESTR